MSISFLWSMLNTRNRFSRQTSISFPWIYRMVHCRTSTNNPAYDASRTGLSKSYMFFCTHAYQHLQFTKYCSAPLLLILQPSLALISNSDLNAQTLPFKAYEPTIELRDRKSRSVYIEVPYTVETGEAERIAVDWTARGGGSGTSCNIDFPLLTVDALHSLVFVVQWSRICKLKDQLSRCYTSVFWSLSNM